VASKALITSRSGPASSAPVAEASGSSLVVQRLARRGQALLEQALLRGEVPADQRDVHAGVVGDGQTAATTRAATGDR
jgi:hypothetical protein